MANHLLTSADIQYLIQSKAWLEMVKRIDAELEKADQRMENPEPFEHGRAVGRRESLRLVKKLPELLLTEIEHPAMRSVK